jgi:hypothetical protein
MELRHKIKKSIPKWISKLLPSEIRSCRDHPEILNMRCNNYSDDTVSAMSKGINLLLTIDMNDPDLLKTSIIKCMANSN